MFFTLYNTAADTPLCIYLHQAETCQYINLANLSVETLYLWNFNLLISGLNNTLFKSCFPKKVLPFSQLRNSNLIGTMLNLLR